MAEELVYIPKGTIIRKEIIEIYEEEDVLETEETIEYTFDEKENAYVGTDSQGNDLVHTVFEMLTAEEIHDFMMDNKDKITDAEREEFKYAYTHKYDKEKKKKIQCKEGYINLAGAKSWFLETYAPTLLAKNIKPKTTPISVLFGEITGDIQE